jgi:hypothetical protein
MKQVIIWRSPVRGDNASDRLEEVSSAIETSRRRVC